MAQMLAEIKVTLDLLNDEPYIVYAQRALDLCDVAERTADAILAGELIDPEPLRYAARYFREFFEDLGSEEG